MKTLVWFRGLEVVDDRFFRISFGWMMSKTLSSNVDTATVDLSTITTAADLKTAAAAAIIAVIQSKSGQTVTSLIPFSF